MLKAAEPLRLVLEDTCIWSPDLVASETEKSAEDAHA